MMRHYASLFDKTYLAKGLAMLDSLQRHSSEPYVVSILALDEETYRVLGELKSDAWVCSLSGLESEYGFLRELRQERTWQEYCWTLASQWMWFLMFHMEYQKLTYLDADLYFFSDPKVVHDEIGDRSIGIIPHRLIPSKQHLEVNGRFNVGWVTIKNTPTGRACVQRWASQVRDRCDASTCGDQKYLDEWPLLYGDECCIIENIGANVAPWNVANWQLSEGPKVDGVPVVFYHAHEFTELGPYEATLQRHQNFFCLADDQSAHYFNLTNYELRNEDRRLIYDPYVNAILRAKDQIAKVTMQLQAERA